MGNWKRIILIIFVLIGSVGFFGYWSINQFDSAFDNLSASYVSNTLPNPSFSKTDTEQISTTSPEVSFTFPQIDDRVYIDCIYPISWQSSSTIKSIEIALIDAGTRDAVGPIASGLAKETAIDADVQNIEWKVGKVWPGDYFIKILKIDGVDTEIKSKTFTINEMPEGTTLEEKEGLCSF